MPVHKICSWPYAAPVLDTRVSRFSLSQALPWFSRLSLLISALELKVSLFEHFSALLLKHNSGRGLLVQERRSAPVLVFTL